MIVEAFAGWLSGSLALVADAGHMLSDAAALTVALVAQRIAARPRSHHRTFGSRRAEVLAAFLNGVALAVSAIWIGREAIERLFTPHPIQGKWMLITAVAGLVINLISAWVLGSGHHENQNTRAAFAHVISDALGSVGAIVAAVLVLQLGWTRADPIIGICIAFLIMWGAWRLVRETTTVLMEGTPSHINVADLEATLKCVPGVCTVHDTHVWTISDGFDAVTAHVVLDGTRHGTDVVADGARLVWERFRIDHVTLQPEAPPPGLVKIRIPKRSSSE
jgi:cobalt-zinc-cadmium efflux system protein